MINPQDSPKTILIRGGGDLASGVALRLYHVGFQVVITELPQPLMVRRTVSFGQAVYSGRWQVEEVIAELAADTSEAREILDRGSIAVLVDPQAECTRQLQPSAIVDARMTKNRSNQPLKGCGCVIGLGPGFIVGENCNALVETKRGHTLGRVYWQGSAEPDSRVPEGVNGVDSQRVIHSPLAGKLETRVKIGERVEAGQVIALVGGKTITSKIKGVVRGMLQDGLQVSEGLKLGDIDPRDDDHLCYQVSDKALAIAGGVLEALLVCSKSDPKPG